MMSGPKHNDNTMFRARMRCEGEEECENLRCLILNDITTRRGRPAGRSKRSKYV